MWCGSGSTPGKTSHHAAAVDAGGKQLWSVKVANGQQPIEELIGRAAKSDGEVRWAVDLVSPAAALLLAILLASGQKAVYVPGRVVHGMAQVFRGEGKTDAKDARIIADTARMRSDLTELTPADELVVELTRLTSYRADLMANWVPRHQPAPRPADQHLPRTGSQLRLLHPVRADPAHRRLHPGRDPPGRTRDRGRLPARARSLGQRHRRNGRPGRPRRQHPDRHTARRGHHGAAGQQAGPPAPGPRPGDQGHRQAADQPVPRPSPGPHHREPARHGTHPGRPSSWSPPTAAPCRPSPAPDGWPPTPASRPSRKTPGASPATTTGPSATTGRCATSST